MVVCYKKELGPQGMMRGVGYARAADQRGVDLIQNCEVTGFNINSGRITGVETTRGRIEAKKLRLLWLVVQAKSLSWRVSDCR